MTDRAEIERLLKQTGRTLEGLPEQYKHCELMSAYDRCETKPYHMICHQSDVIELLAGALKDALEKPMQKPMQKPLTLEEVKNLCETGCHCIYVEHYHANQDIENPITPNIGIKSGSGYRITHCNGYRYKFLWESYGRSWRCWASRPTDEEREAAAWEI